MKFFASLLLLSAFAFAFSACTTPANNRDLYKPAKGHGYWTDRYYGPNSREGIFGISNSADKAY